MNRRSFLTTLASTCVAVSATRACGGALLAKSPAPPRRVPLVDAHVHISSPEMQQAVERSMGHSPFPALDADGLVERLGREGISRAWLLSEAYLMASDVWQLGQGTDERTLVQRENDFVAREAARFPDRLEPFCSLNPKREYALEEIDRCAGRGMRGLKLHCWNSLLDVRETEHRDRLRAVLQRAASKGMPVVVHAFNGSVAGYGAEDVAIWARDLVLPEERLRICFAHLGGAGGFDPPVQEVLTALVEQLGPRSAAAGRVFVDLSAVLVGANSLGLPPTPPAQRERMAQLLEAWGCDRVLWGSDSIPDYLALSREAWPLGEEHWATVCRQTAGVGGPAPRAPGRS